MNAAIEPDPLAETHGKYTKVQNLGQGSFGFVQLGKAGNGDLAAIKVRQKKLPFHRAWPRSQIRHPLPQLQFLKRGAINKYVEAEIMNHSKLRHPHVIQFKVGRCLAWAAIS